MYAVFQKNYKNKKAKPVTLKTLEEHINEEGNPIFSKDLLVETTTKPFYQQINDKKQKAAWRK